MADKLKLVAEVKLVVPTEVHTLPLATMVRCNQAADWLSRKIWKLQSFDRFAVQHAFYYELRERFGLSAQHACLTIGKVAASYKRERTLHRFRSWGSIAFDARTYTLRLLDDGATVSLTLLDGRTTFALAMDDRTRTMLAGKRGEADLCYRRGKWFLQVSVTVLEAHEYVPAGWLGVDVGIANLAVDSDGAVYGETVRAVRVRNRRLRSVLQHRWTKSAKRHLKKLSGREHRFSAHTNHCISKAVVKKAQGTGRGIALEDLSGIRGRVTASRGLRREIGSWAFYDLDQKTLYKAKLAGTPVRFVDPRYTSQQCPACGLVDRANRPSQAVFRCTGCGETGHADHVAARNIAVRAAVNQPIVAPIRARNRPRKGQTGIPTRGSCKLLSEGCGAFFRKPQPQAGCLLK